MTRGSRAVLLVEDSDDDAELTKTAFLRACFENPIYVVHHGEEAIQYLGGDGRYADRAKFPSPQLILLDLSIAGMSGWKVLEWIRRKPQFGSLPVNVLSGSASPGDEKKAQDLGANAY